MLSRSSFRNEELTPQLLGMLSMMAPRSQLPSGIDLAEKQNELSCSRSKQGALCSMPEQCRTYKDLAPLSQAGTALKSNRRSRAPQDISRGLHQLLPTPSHVSFPSFPQVLISRVLLNKYLVC